MIHQDSSGSTLVAITGATGLVGSHLVAELLREGHFSLRLLMRDRDRLGLLPATLKRYGLEDRIEELERFELSLSNPLQLEEALTGVGRVYHCAAVVSYDPEREEELITLNTEMTTQVARAALSCGVGLLIHVSSIATLGLPKQGESLITEESVPLTLQGKSAYAIGKFYSENAVRAFALSGLKTIIINPSIILGEGDPALSSTKLVALALGKVVPMTPGVKGYVDVRDVARAMVVLSERPDAVGRRFVISAENLSFSELFDRLAKAVEKRALRIRMGKFSFSLLYGTDRLVAFVTGRKPRMDRALRSNALESSFYSGEELTRQTGFVYTPMQETIERIARAYVEEKRMK